MPILAHSENSILKMDEHSGLILERYSDNYQTLTGPAYNHLKTLADQVSQLEGSSNGQDSRISTEYRRRANRVLDTIIKLPAEPETVVFE